MEDGRKNPGSRRYIREQRQKKINKRFILISVIILFVMTVLVPVKNMVIRHFISYGTLEWGTLEEAVQAPALVIRKEQVVTSPAQGKFTPSVREWEKVPVGHLVGYLKTEKATQTQDRVKIALRAPEPGLVSYHLDGLEEILTQDLLERLDTNKLAGLINEPEQAQPVTQVAGGKPVFKIVDNLVDPFLYLRLPANALAVVPKRGEFLPVRVNKAGVQNCRVADLKIDAKELQLVLEVQDASDPELTVRRVNVDIVPRSFKGLIVNITSLVMKNNQPGLLVPDDRVVRWQKVRLVGKIGEQAAVSGIETGAQYIINPSWIKEGQRID